MDLKLRRGAHCNADTICAFCTSQIAHHKAPQHIRFVDSFPMTAIGKIQKFVMREQTIQELNAHREMN